MQAGAGDDSVTNEAVPYAGSLVELGTGADHFVGADYAERCTAPGRGSPHDTEVGRHRDPRR